MFIPTSTLDDDRENLSLLLEVYQNAMMQANQSESRACAFLLTN